MKKFLKCFLIVPIIFIAICTLFACGDEDLKTISLSIPNYSLSNGFYSLDMANISGDTKRVNLKVELNPNTFTPGMLDYESDNRDVADVTKRQDTIYIILHNVGQATITAKYKTKQDKEIKSFIKILVADTTSSISFNRYTYTTTYSGQDIKGNYIIEQDDGSGYVEGYAPTTPPVEGEGEGEEDDDLPKYEYKYYSIDTDKNNAQKEVKEIVDAGRYRITCTNPLNENDFAETFLIINRYKFSFTAGNYEGKFGDELPQNLYYEGDIPDNVTTAEVPTEILYGIGRDEAKPIGRIVEVTSAYRGIGVSNNYETKVKMSIAPEWQRNYDTAYNVKEGNLKITAKEVFLKGKDQIVTYGANNRYAFDLYDYKEYVDNGNSTEGIEPLDSSFINYSKNINIGTPTFKNSKGQNASLNGAEKLDVLIKEKDPSDPNYNIVEYDAYQVFFTNATSNRNIIIRGSVGGLLTVEPRSVIILPTKGQYKNYGSADPTNLTFSVVEGGFLAYDYSNTLINPLKLNYHIPEGGSLGEGNYLANVDHYYYEVDNTLNRNYDIILSSLATIDGGAEPEQRVLFEVKPCPIVIKLRDKEALYKTPTGSVVGGEKIHTVGYYGETFDYKLEIDSVKIDNIDADLSDIEGSGSGTAGRIPLITIGYFSFGIKVVKVASVEGYFMTYETEIASEDFGGLAEKINYKITFDTSLVNLTKQKIIIVPKASANFRKAYDANTDDSLLFEIGANFYDAYDEAGDEVDLEDIVSNETLITLLNGEAYSRSDDGVVFEDVNVFKDVGSYKIFLIDQKEISYKLGMEFYELVLDTSRVYTYEITPRNVFIIPDVGQSKIYGMKEPAIRYTYTNMPSGDSTPVVSGALTRQAGENVGEYAIEIDKLSFGKNFVLLLDTTNSAMFKIEPRKVTIEPNSSSYVYGEIDAAITFTQKIENVQSTDNFEHAPSFIGSFAILRDPLDPTSVASRDSAGFYPVLLDDTHKVISYTIGLGTFESKTNNYYVSFVEGCTFAITKREALIEIIPRSVASLSGVPTTNFNLEDNYFSISNLIGNNVTSTLNILLNRENSYYCNVEEFTVNINLGSTNVTGNYDFNLISKTVYKINLAILDLKIIALRDDGTLSNTSTYEGVYKGTAFEDIYQLVCVAEGFPVGRFTIDYENSKFDYLFTSGLISTNQPINVGSYVARVDLSADDAKIIIIDYNADTEETRTIEFTKNDIGTDVSNTVVNFANNGYLNIKKARISYSAENVAFEKAFTYVEPGQSDTELMKLMPKLKTTIDNTSNPVFVGVNNETIKLRTYTDTTLNYVASGFSFSNFKANYSYNIIVSVQALKMQNGTVVYENGREVVDGNYETLTIPAVSLKIDPKRISVGEGRFETRKPGDNIRNLSYDGYLKSLNLTLTTAGQGTPNYTISYSYQKLSIIYSDSVTGRVPYRNYDYVTDGPSETGGTNYLECENLPNVITSFKIKAVGVNYYAIINRTYCFAMQSGGGSGVSPDSAGAYICIATCNAFENYCFENASLELSSSVEFACLFEIKKSGNIALENWRRNFYFSTQFDFTNPSKLPFEYNMYPSYLKEAVTYTINTNVGDTTGGYLPVGEYTVTLRVENASYYKVFEETFVVEKLAVDFVFPTQNEYVYIGINAPVTTFLTNTRVVLRNGDGSVKESFYYDVDDPRCADIVTHYIDKDAVGGGSDYISAPYNIGNYKLVMIYGTEDTSGVNNYYGKGEFDYSIVRRQYSRSIRVEPATIAYNPLYTPQAFYDQIVSSMFAIDCAPSEYTLKVYMGSIPTPTNLLDRNERIDFTTATSANDLGWLAILNNEGQHYVSFQVIFTDTTLETISMPAILTVKRYQLESKSFNYSITRNRYTYNGKRIYNHIAFSMGGRTTVELNPEAENRNPIIDGQYVYHYIVRNEGERKYVVLEDNLFNTIFEIRYSYEYLGSERELAPISPGVYDVHYNITGGDNYLVSALNLDSAGTTFEIEKIRTLYISMENLRNPLDLVYKESNLLTGSGDNLKLGNEYLKSLITVKSNDTILQSNVYFSLYYNGIYKEEYGVYLKMFFKNSRGEITEDITEAGNYTMHLGISYAMGYDIILFFDEVRVGLLGNPKPTYGLHKDTNGEWYDYIYSQSFEVRKATNKISIANWVEGFSLGGSNVRVVVGADGNSEIRVGPGEFIALTALEVHVWNNNVINENILYSMSANEMVQLNLGTRYAIRIKGDENHNDSAYITISIEY